jgi:lipid II isoglutaminyl synthase (glutamine-hydrolysing)
MLRLKIAIARLVGRLSRVSRRGGGTSLPGKLLLRLAPDAVSQLGRTLPRGSVIVSATNGKTTTAGMVASVLAQAGIAAVHNRSGANMPGGVATALLERSRRGRPEGAEIGLFEVDEAWLETLVSELDPRTVVLGNLFRDQLDRYGELERLADDWAAVARSSEQTLLVLNADDPLVVDVGRTDSGERRPRTLYFGVEDHSHALPELEHAFDAKHCRRCGAPYSYTRAYLGHLGDYSCPRCGNARPPPDVAASRITFEGMSGSRVAMETPDGTVEFSLALPGLYNVYNALAASACCLSLGIPLETIKKGLESFAAAFGRAERLAIGSRSLSILLIKNPAGANEVFRTLAATARRPDASDGGLDLLIALNDRIADGRDISWIWDADFEILSRDAGHVVCAGTRAPELALRLKYAGIAPERLEVVEAIPAALGRALESEPGRPLYALPTYTALLELRELLAARGYARPYWEQA